jgi:hypothetical protein
MIGRTIFSVAVLGAMIMPTSTTSKAESGCHPAYGTGCVPIASDVDCAGGNGNGPAYVVGPVIVNVIGNDPYDLDSDHDGIGCEPTRR